MNKFCSVTLLNTSSTLHIFYTSASAYYCSIVLFAFISLGNLSWNFPVAWSFANLFDGYYIAYRYSRKDFQDRLSPLFTGVEMEDDLYFAHIQLLNVVTSDPFKEWSSIQFGFSLMIKLHYHSSRKVSKEPMTKKHLHDQKVCFNLWFKPLERLGNVATDCFIYWKWFISKLNKNVTLVMLQSLEN